MAIKVITIQQHIRDMSVGRVRGDELMIYCFSRVFKITTGVITAHRIWCSHPKVSLDKVDMFLIYRGDSFYDMTVSGTVVNPMNFSVNGCAVPQTSYESDGSASTRPYGHSSDENDLDGTVHSNDTSDKVPFRPEWQADLDNVIMPLLDKLNSDWMPTEVDANEHCDECEIGNCTDTRHTAYLSSQSFSDTSFESDILSIDLLENSVSDMDKPAGKSKDDYSDVQQGNPMQPSYCSNCSICRAGKVAVPRSNASDDGQSDFSGLYTSKKVLKLVSMKMQLALIM